jgi:primosomal replication protein N
MHITVITLALSMFMYPSFAKVKKQSPAEINHCLELLRVYSKQVNIPSKRVAALKTEKAIVDKCVNFK